MEKKLKETLPDGRFKDVSPRRSRNMRAIRGSGNRSTELRLRMALVRSELSGWRVRPANLPGSPDFYFKSLKLAVFVDGCFWHGCPECGHIPKTRSKFWEKKIRTNAHRDARTTDQLLSDGYRVRRFWEHELERNLASCIDCIRKELE